MLERLHYYAALPNPSKSYQTVLTRRWPVAHTLPCPAAATCRPWHPTPCPTAPLLALLVYPVPRACYNPIGNSLFTRALHACAPNKPCHAICHAMQTMCHAALLGPAWRGKRSVLLAGHPLPLRPRTSHMRAGQGGRGLLIAALKAWGHGVLRQLGRPLQGPLVLASGRLLITLGGLLLAVQARAQREDLLELGGVLAEASHSRLAHGTPCGSAPCDRRLRRQRSAPCATCTWCMRI